MLNCGLRIRKPRGVASPIMGLSSGSSRPTPEDKVESRARNLFVISAAVIAYLFAGAKLDQLTVLGLRAPASYPIVFRCAATMALVWFWWRYPVAWIDARSRVEFRRDFFESLRQTRIFQQHFLKSIDVDQVADAAAKKYGAIVGGPLHFDRVIVDGDRRFSAKIEQVTLVTSADPPNRYSIQAGQMPNYEPIVIAVPWWLHYSLGIPYFWWRAVRHEHFANRVLPHVLFIIAIALICCKSFGIEPAGIFGILSAATV